MKQTCLIAALTLGLSVLSGCNRDSKPYEEVRPVRTEVAQQGGSAGTADYAGTVTARREVQLGFRLGGRIVERSVELGRHVRANEVLYRLDGRDLALQTSAAKSRLDQATMDFNRARELKNNGFVSQSNVDQTKASLDVADAQYKLAANQDGYTLLKAEHDGVVTNVSAEAGQVVAPGQPVVTIAEDGEREVAISVPESRVGEIKDAGTFDVKLWAAPGHHYTGRLRDMAVDTDQATRTYAARITIVNADANVRLGMTANVTLPTSPMQGVPMPLTAIYDTDGKPRVWIVDKTSETVHSQSVQLGEVHGDRVWITAGVKSGDVIVTAGAHVLHEGERVRLAQSQLVRP